MKKIKAPYILGIALLGLTAHGFAASTTYDVDLTLTGCCGGPASGTVSGFIETDGTVGTINAVNVLDWDLDIALVGQPDQILLGPEESGANSVWVESGNDLSATSSTLSFDTASSSGGVVDICQGDGCSWRSDYNILVQDENPSNGAYSTFQANTNYGALLESCQYPDNCGNLTLGDAEAATPEPTTWLSMAIGLGGLTLWKFRSRATVRKQPGEHPSRSRRIRR